MDVKKTTTILSALVLIVAISGCLGGGGGGQETQQPTDQGVVITDIKTDFNTIEAGEEMTLAVDLENRGDKTAKNIWGEIIRQGSFTVEPEYGTNSSKTTDLEPPIEGTYSGDEFVWNVKAPSVSEERQEELQGRVHYDYSTEGFATVHFVPREILREKGKSAFPMDPSSSYGPLDIDVVANQPAVLRDTDKPICAGGDFNCGNITDESACEGLGCTYSGGSCSGSAEVENCAGIVREDYEQNTENYCKAVGALGGTRCRWGMAKEVRMTITINNVGDGVVEKNTESGEEDVIRSLKVEGIGGPACNTLNEDLTDVSVLDKKIGTFQLIKGEQAQKTLSNHFFGMNRDAATSCQIRVTADYSYRTDSRVLSVNVKPKL